MWFFIALCLGVVTGMIASSKGRPFFGWFLFGALLSIVAIPAIILAPNLKTQAQEMARRVNSRLCPECAEPILRVARKCKHCGSAVEPIKDEPAPAANTPLEASQSWSFPKTILAVVVGLVALGALFAAFTSRDRYRPTYSEARFQPTPKAEKVKEQLPAIQRHAEQVSLPNGLVVMVGQREERIEIVIHADRRPSTEILKELRRALCPSVSSPAWGGLDPVTAGVWVEHMTAREFIGYCF